MGVVLVYLEFISFVFFFGIYFFIFNLGFVFFCFIGERYVVYSRFFFISGN